MSVRRVLIVDDDAMIRETLERTLRRWSYEATAVGSAESALSTLGALDPAVVITDVRMGGMSGLDLLDTVRRMVPETDVIVMTAFEDMRTAVRAMKAGAYEFLVKPLDLDQIEITLQRCFRDRALRRRVARQAELDAASAGQYALSELVGRTPAMIGVYKTVGAVAESQAAVLVRGETGTGKELVARAIHFNSSAANEPFVAINCTAVPETLLESELFGHVRGAFTGATSDRKGRFELAGTGTVFLDEIGDTSLAFQAKLLRVLQEREYVPVGAERPKRSEARIIAATHRNLEELVARGMFREDLYYRLRVVEIVLPPLRERRDDIRLLAEYVLHRAAADMHRAAKVLTPDALTALMDHDWPGNVRELENAVVRALLLSRGAGITAADVVMPSPAAATAPASPGAGGTAHDWSLRGVEREHVIRVLEHARGNKRKAARLLGVSRAKLDRLLARHGIERTTGTVPEH